MLATGNGLESVRRPPLDSSPRAAPRAAVFHSRRVPPTQPPTPTKSPSKPSYASSPSAKRPLRSNSSLSSATTPPPNIRTLRSRRSNEPLQGGDNDEVTIERENALNNSSSKKLKKTENEKEEEEEEEEKMSEESATVCTLRVEDQVAADVSLVLSLTQCRDTNNMQQDAQDRL